MAPKKSKGKQTEKKTVDKKDDKRPPTPPPASPSPAPPVKQEQEQEQEQEPIPVPEPLPLPVPAPTSRHHSDSVKSSKQHLDDQDGPPDSEGWADNGTWGDGGGGGKWGSHDGWGEESANSRDDGIDSESNHGESGWGQADTHVQAQPSLGQPVHNHAPVEDNHQTPAPPPQPAITTQPSQPHDQSSGTQHSKTTLPLAQGQNPKGYTSASAMANRNRSVPPQTNPAPAPSRPSYIWEPNQPPPPKQRISTTGGPHNPPLTNLTPWGEPKNVDPWGDPKPKPKPALAHAPAVASQGRPAWLEWGRQPQPPARVPPVHPQSIRRNYDYDYDYDSEDGDYSEDDDATFTGHGAWRHVSGGQQGWGSNPRNQKVNITPQGSSIGVGTGSRPALSSTEHSQMLDAMLNNMPQGQSNHHPQHHGHHQHVPSRTNPELTHHQLERARRLQQIAEEQRLMALRYQQQNEHHRHPQGGGKSTKKSQKSSGWQDNGWEAPRDEWGASSANAGGWGNSGDGWGHGESRNGWGQNGNDRGNDGGDDYDNVGWGNSGGDGWGNNSGGDGWGNNGGGDGWGNNSGGDGQGNNSGGDGWGNNSDGDGWGNNNGGDGWGNNSGGDGWGNSSGDGRDHGGGRGRAGGEDGWGKDGGKQHKGHDGGWGSHDNSWSNTKGSANDWDANGWSQNDGWGDEEEWDEDEDDGWEERSRYRVTDNAAQHKSSNTLMHALNGSDAKPSKPSTSAKLDLPPGAINESGNKAFEPAMRAIFGKERFARERIYWTYHPQNEPQVVSVILWIEQMEAYLAHLGLLKFLETKERGALFVNVTFRLKEQPQRPAFDWLSYDQIQASTDRILQHSILACDPAQQTLIFIYLLSKTGNSVAMWRRKLQVPQDARQKHLQSITKVKAGLRPDKDYAIHVDELPPSNKGKRAKTAKLSKPTAKEANKPVPAKAQKSALKTHHRGQSLPTVPEKKRKWWQILRFAD